MYNANSKNHGALGPAEAHRGLKEMIDGQETMATRAGRLLGASLDSTPSPFLKPSLYPPLSLSLSFSRYLQALTLSFSLCRATSHPRHLRLRFNLHTADHVFRFDSPSSCYPRHASRPSIKPRLFLPPSRPTSPPFPRTSSRGHRSCHATR